MTRIPTLIPTRTGKSQVAPRRLGRFALVNRQSKRRTSSLPSLDSHCHQNKHESRLRSNAWPVPSRQPISMSFGLQVASGQLRHPRAPPLASELQLCCFLMPTKRRHSICSKSFNYAPLASGETAKRAEKTIPDTFNGYLSGPYANSFASRSTREARHAHEASESRPNELFACAKRGHNLSEFCWGEPREANDDDD